MSASITLLVVAAILCGTGVYVMLERSLTRILIGFLLVGNGINLLLFLMSGRPGPAPLISDPSQADTIVDPLPQVLMLTAIVINFGITAFLLALIYRSWWLANLGDEGDTISDDEQEDAEAAARSAQMSESIEAEDEAMRTELGEDDDVHESSPHGERTPRGGRTAHGERRPRGGRGEGS